MFMRTVLLVTLGSLILFSSLTFAEKKTPQLFPLIQTDKIQSIDLHSHRPRFSTTSTFRVLEDSGQTVYEIIASGEGAFDGYKNAKCTVTSRMSAENDRFKPLTTKTVIVDLTRQNTLTKETRFDYEQKKIFIKSFTGKETIAKNYTFPIKGPTADYATLSCFLKPYIPQIMKGKVAHFYLLSMEPRLYGVDVKFVKKEILNLPIGKKNAIKLRLIADFVMVGDEVLDKVIPPTFIWYGAHTPFHWLQYQGMETGLHSTNIRAYLVEDD